MRILKIVNHHTFCFRVYEYDEWGETMDIVCEDTLHMIIVLFKHLFRIDY